MSPTTTKRALTIGVDCRFIQDKFHGIGRYTYHLLAYMCQIEGPHTITAFVDPSLPNSRFPLDALVQSGRLRIQPITLPMYHPNELIAWRAVLRANPIDVLHVPYFWASPLLPCPLVITIHDMIFDRYPQYMPQRQYALVYKLATWAALQASRRVIAVSDATKRDIIALTRTPAAKVCVVPEGVDDVFQPVTDPAVQAAVRAKYGLPARYLLALGARRPHKNIARLVEAFDRIVDDVPHTLVLVGTVDARFATADSPAFARLHAAGRLLEIGYVAEEDLPTLYAMADLFVQPSIIEGFGLPVLEAMACGCPVACSNTSSLPEVAGDAALLFDPLSSDSVAAIIRQILGSTELRRELRARGLQQAAKFTWQVAAQQTLALYYDAAEAIYV